MLQRCAWLVVLLSGGALLVGNLILGALVAPTLFRVLTTDHAGMGFGNILRLWTDVFAWPLVILCVGALTIIFVIRLMRGHSNWFTAVAVLAIGLVLSHWWSANLVQQSMEVRDFMRNEQPLRNTPSLASDDNRAVLLKKHFDYLHRSSTRAFMVETINALLIVILSGGALLAAKGNEQSKRDDELI